MYTDDLVRQLPRLLSPLSRLIRRAVRADPPLPLLPYAQVEVLRAVQEVPGISVGGVADSLQLAPNTVSTLVRILVESGHLEQTSLPGEGRTTRLTLTTEARQMIDVWDQRRAVLVNDVLDQLSEDHVAALRAAVPALLRLQEELERRVGDRQGPAERTTRV